MLSLKEIEESALDSQTEITDLLRKCMVLSVRLGNDEFYKWIRQELNGYKKKDLPMYRIIKSGSFGTFTNGGSICRNISIPLYPIPEEFREVVTTTYFTNPIKALASMVENTDGDSLKLIWQADLIQMLGNRIYPDWTCMQAYVSVPLSQISGIIDTVRTRILDFILAIEKELPNAGEASLDDLDISSERVGQLYYVHIQGNVENFAAGGKAITQMSHREIHQGDFESLKRYFVSLGIDTPNIEELGEIMIEEEKDGVEKGIGDRTKAWIEKAALKISPGVSGLAIGATANLLATAIKLYLGLQA